MATEHEIAQTRIIGIATAIARKWANGDEASEYDRSKLIEAIGDYFGAEDDDT